MPIIGSGRWVLSKEIIELLNTLKSQQKTGMHFSAAGDFGRTNFVFSAL